jgi:hypothetical protein
VCWAIPENIVAALVASAKADTSQQVVEHHEKKRAEAKITAGIVDLERRCGG